MGVDGDLAKSAVRLSLGWASLEADVEKFAVVWRDISRRLVKSGSKAA